MLEGLKPLFNNVLRPFVRFVARLGLTPNHLTLIGLVLFIGVGFFCAINKWYTAFIFGLIGACMDGMDGQLARETGKKTTFGAILDSSVDRITEAAVLLGLLFYYTKAGSVFGIYFCYGGIVTSMMVSYIKARCEGMGVSCKRGILQRPERIIILGIGLLFGPTVMIWILGALTLFGLITSIERLFEAFRNSKAST